jgi:hypothetical protein
MSTNVANPQVPHVYLRIGSHAEKEYFQKLGGFFDGILIGGNLMESAPWASAGLLTGLPRKRPFLIDPMTYAFGAFTDADGHLQSNLNWLCSVDKKKKKLQLKRSYNLLSKALGEPFISACQRRRALGPSDFVDDAILVSTCQSVMMYQYQRMEKVYAEDPAYKDFAGAVQKPEAIFAPYLFIDRSNVSDLCSLAVRFAKASAAARIEGTKVHSILCADASLLSNVVEWKKTINGLKASGVDYVWIWISGLKEETADLATLVAMRDAIVSLSEEVQVGNLHGGFFSLALSYWGLSAVSHSVGYGEQKDVAPVVGQALPMVRYYLPPLHLRLSVPEIERSFSNVGVDSVSAFHAVVCGCTICRGVLSKGLKAFSEFGDMRLNPGKKKKTQTPAAAKLCRFHYLLSRVAERDHVKTTAKTDVLVELRQSRLLWEKSPTTVGKTRHLEKWISALSGEGMSAVESIEL